MGTQRANFGRNSSLSPGAYNLETVEITTHDGKKYDIENIVVKLNITESLYSPNILANISIKDSANFFESSPLIGQEKIQIIISTNPNTNGNVKERKISLDFVVTEYPLYASADEEHVNVYVINCVSEHAYYSKLKKISRAFTNNTDKEIERIIKKDLQFAGNIVIDGETISRAKGIINWQTPLEAIEWLRKKTYDGNHSPFFFYHTLDNTIHLSSLHNLLTAEEYHTYHDHREFNQLPYTKEDYDQRVSRILSVTSNLKFGKVYQGINGGWASENNYLDYSRKTYTKYDYNYDKDFKQNLTLNKKNPLSATFDVNGEKLNLMSKSHLEHISVNNLAFSEDGKDMNYNTLQENTHGKTRSIEEALETASHDIKLFGDFKLNPGTVINLKFPKSIDPAGMKKFLANMKNKSKTDRDLIDQHLSGRHLITSVNHVFDGGEYFSELRVKKDSFNIEL